MKKTIKYLALALIPVLLSSCLKDDPNNLDPKAGTNNVIEFKNIATISSPQTSKYPKYSISFDLTPTYDLNLVINYSGSESAAPEDITVDLAVDPTIITQYNTQNTTAFTPLPASLYTPTLQVVIPKGQKSATAKFVLKPGQFNLAESYALGLKITKSSFGIISGNFGSAVFTVAAKNKYDGVYKLTGTMNDTRSSTLTGAYPLDNIELVTTGPNTVEYYDADYGISGHIIRTGTGGLSYYGSFVPVFEFNSTGKVISVVNGFGQPASNGRSGRLDITGINQYTETGTKKLEVSYVMVQSGDRTFFKETFTYKGPR